MSYCGHASSVAHAPHRAPLGAASWRRGPRGHALRRLAVGSEKEAALQQLRASNEAMAERLAAVEEKVKQENRAEREAATPPVAATTSADFDGPGLEEIDQFNFYDKVKGAATPVVVVDFFTEWCGPCKLMYPRLVDMSAEMAGQVTFFKFNCSKKNKELGVELGVKVAPTFFVYKNGEKAGSMTGAKVDELRALIASVSSS